MWYVSGINKNKIEITRSINGEKISMDKKVLAAKILRGDFGKNDIWGISYNWYDFPRTLKFTHVTIQENVPTPQLVVGKFYKVNVNRLNKVVRGYAFHLVEGLYSDSYTFITESGDYEYISVEDISDFEEIFDVDENFLRNCQKIASLQNCIDAQWAAIDAIKHTISRYELEMKKCFNHINPDKFEWVNGEF